MNQKKQNVSMSVIRRLPRYYRFLTELRKKGETRISSKELSQRMGFTASQIRQDFNCFGGFGQQGYGYNVPQLCQEIEKILGIQRRHPCILVGAGNLGKAIARHMPFEQLGFSLIGVFDNSPRVIGGKIIDHEVLDYAGIEDFTASTIQPWPFSASPRSRWNLFLTHCMGLGSAPFGTSATMTLP